MAVHSVTQRGTFTVWAFSHQPLSAAICAWLVKDRAVDAKVSAYELRVRAHMARYYIEDNADLETYWRERISDSHLLLDWDPKISQATM